MADDRFRALVLEDDPDAADFLRIALERHGGMHVDVARTADDALAPLREQHLRRAPQRHRAARAVGAARCCRRRTEIDPTLTVMIVTAYPTFDHAVEALREAADDFLVKPVTAAQVVERATELARRARERADVVTPAGPGDRCAPGRRRDRGGRDARRARGRR